MTELIRLLIAALLINIASLLWRLSMFIDNDLSVEIAKKVVTELHEEGKLDDLINEIIND